MKKRMFAYVLLLVMAVGILAACNEGNADNLSGDVSEGDTFFGYTLPEDMEKFKGTTVKVLSTATNDD
ncbi:MAG: hypothetical protein J6V56_01880, partial [Clostridia bacterium]|nr:hypothetical protein [Clostridia bacterium]